MADVTVLSITGWCRNGSTIIGNLLNEAPGVVHVGELHFLWRNAAGKGVNCLCGCGTVLTECPLWSRILAEGAPADVPLDEFAERVIHRQRACVRTRHTWRVLRRGLHDDDIRAHAELMATTYRTIAARTGARVIVETNKIPGESALLARLDGVNPYYVHLVRDPFAVAESWREPKEYVYTMSASKSTAYWHGFNLAAQALTRRYPERSLFLRYEDFAADPSGAIGDMLRLCGAGPAGNPLRGRTIELHTNHTVTGNPDRLRTGPTTIREHDDAWRTGLGARARLATAALSWPLALRYGYRHGPAAAGDDPREANAPSAVGEGTVGSGA